MATKKAAKKAKKTAKIDVPESEPIKPVDVSPVSEAAPEADVPPPPPTTGIVDPIGDTTDGEAKVYLGDEAPAESAAGEIPEAETDAADSDDAEAEFTPAPRPPAKLERLQKILSQAGVASRRKAEEMIEQGRVQVNGTVVTALGTKADANRDHIRVDGKLLHGAERLRYFVLNKPKGFVTTVKDPEGRPTVMQFFEKMRERLYPVGRLDYMSEGLLLVTNDGELANKLTKAGSGVEKVYLVKVAGQPSEAELDILRGGVSIERGKPGSPQVRTSPARIRQVRQGDNPWYEVVLIEGRNRELRKMFSAVGHFVEKIRRVGYGPLVLDQEPGNLRELDPEELAALRLAAEGKLRTPKAKELRRRNLSDAQLPTVQPKPTRPRPAKPFEARKPFESRRPLDSSKLGQRPAVSERPGEVRPKRPFSADKPFRPFRPAAEVPRPDQSRSGAGPAKFGDRRFGPQRSARPGSAPSRPAWKRDDRAQRPPARFAAGPTEGTRPASGRAYGGRPEGKPFAGKPASGKPTFGKPAWKKPGPVDRPPFKQRPVSPRPEPSARAEDFTPFKPGNLRIDPIESDRSEARPSRTFSKPPAHSGAGRPPYDRPRTGKPAFGKPRFEKSGPAKPRFEKPRYEKPRPEKPSFDRPASGRPSAPRRSDSRPSGPSRAPRNESGLARPFTTSSGKPRPGGARPSSKPPRAGGFSKPKPGGFSKSGPRGSGYKSKPGGAKRTGLRNGGKKRG